MDQLYGWVRNITCYLIFMTVLTNILPDKKYEKYMKLFAGMVLILIVLKPLTSGLHLDDQIAYFFESITFQSQTDDLKKELSGMEEKRLSSMMGQYEQAVSMDLKEAVEAAGYYTKQVYVTIEEDQSSEKFGSVTGISIVITTEQAGTEGTQEIHGMEPVDPVNPVRIGGEKTEKTDSDPGGAARERHEQENSSVRALRQKLEQYYNLEAQHVEIRMEDG